MPIDEDRDDGRRRLRWTVLPPLTLTEVVSQLGDVLAADRWRYALVVDLRQAILTGADLDRLLLAVQQLAGQHGPPGPVALVTRQPRGLAEAQLYSTRAAAVGLWVEVFSDVDEANRWLDALI